MSVNQYLFWLTIILIGLFAGATFAIVQWIALYGQSLHV